MSAHPNSKRAPITVTRGIKKAKIVTHFKCLNGGCRNEWLQGGCYPKCPNCRCESASILDSGPPKAVTARALRGRNVNRSRVMKEPPLSKSDHTHKCADCGHEWHCLDFTLKRCKATGVFRAVQVNGQGPFCNFHRHLRMAIRFAQHRGLNERDVHRAVTKLFPDP